MNHARHSVEIEKYMLRIESQSFVKKKKIKDTDRQTTSQRNMRQKNGQKTVKKSCNFFVKKYFSVLDRSKYC